MTTETVRTDHEIRLNGIRYPIRGTVTRTLISQWPGKITIGANDRDNHPNHSIYALTDFTGGIGIERLVGESEIDRLWWSTFDISYEGHMVLPPRVQMLPALSNVGIVTALGDLNGYIYAVFNRSVYRYEPADGWGSAVHTLDGDPTHMVRMTVGGENTLLVAHSEGVAYTTDGETWQDTAGNRDDSGDFDIGTAGADSAYAIVLVGDNLYVGDSVDNKFYGFTKDGTRSAGRDIDDLPTSDLQGAAASSTHIFLLDDDSTVKAITTAGVRESGLDFSRDALNTEPRGIAVKSDDKTILIADRSRRKAFAHQIISSIGRVSSLDFVPSGLDQLRDITEYDGVIWGLSNDDLSKIFAFGQYGTSIADKQISLPFSSGWEFLANDGTSLWACNSTRSELYCWTISTLTRDTDRDTPLVINNGDPEGMFADNDVVYVWDGTDEVLYPYDFSP